MLASLRLYAIAGGVVVAGGLTALHFATRTKKTPQDLERIEQAIPPDAAAGERYGAPQMADLDSERVN